MQAVQWSGGIAAYSLVTSKLLWAHQLPAIQLSVDVCCARLAISAHAGTAVLYDASGPLGQGLGVLQKSVHAAQFMQAGPLGPTKVNFHCHVHYVVSASPHPSRCWLPYMLLFVWFIADA